MNKLTREVPAGIRYISDWFDFSLNDYTRPTIINKQITGCGFTEYCLRNDMDIILCSPRVILLENKTEQHEKEDNILYVRNNIEKSVFMDKNLNRIKMSKDSETSDDLSTAKTDILNLKNSIKSHYNHCIASELFSEDKKRKPCKILVTYDSFRHVKEALGEDIKNFYIVIDEFQSIFVDSKFKSSTEMEFVAQLQGLNKVIYLSATPMLDSYLELLDEFKDLDYVDLDWGAKDHNRVIRPVLDVFTYKGGITTEVKKVIDSYKNGEFEKAGVFDEDGKLIGEIVSNEAVIYVNSVKNICDIISGCKLKPEEVNVLCSKSSENEKDVRAAFRRAGTELSKKIEETGSLDKEKKDEIIKKIKDEYKTDTPIGKVPKLGEKHKMFTLCTRTVYLGADFYSTCARSFVFSDANIDCLCVDITLDLPQILGRQRLETNPWKNYATLYFKPLGKTKEKTQEMFNSFVERKLKNTKSLLKTWGNIQEQEDQGILADLYKRVAETENYRDNYVAVNCHSGSSKLPVFNNLVLIAEKRAFDIQQTDYKDRFSVFSTLRDKNEVTNENINKIVEMVDIRAPGRFSEKMKLVCENDLTSEEQTLLINSISPEFRNFYNVLGPERCKALKYVKGYLQEEYDRLVTDTTDEISSVIYSVFKEKETYSFVYIKEVLKEIYTDHNYKKTPKASDLLNYFEVTEAMIKNKDTGKRDHCYKLLIKKKL